MEKEFGVELSEGVSEFINGEERERARRKAAQKPRRIFLAVKEGARTSNRSSPYARKDTSTAGINVPRRRRRDETPASIPTPTPAPAPPLFGTPEPHYYSETSNTATGHSSPWKSAVPLESPPSLEDPLPESDGEVSECNGEDYVDPLPEFHKQGWPDDAIVEPEDDGLHDTQPPLDYGKFFFASTLHPNN